MKYIRGFLMAWGCFCWIPCPYKKWNEEDRPAMLAMLPLLGTFLGVITGLVWLVLNLLQVPAVLTGAVTCGAYFLLTGFIHLDGYMDCCDAVLPRHPDQARRREILKDPHVGAFGVIALVLMLLIFAGSVSALAETNWIGDGGGEEGRIAFGRAIAVAVAFSVMMTVSRGVAAAAVLTERPMETSQYAVMKGKGTLPVVWILLVTLAGMAFAWWGLPEIMAVPGDSLKFCVTQVGLTAVAALSAARIAGASDRKALGGMNGDIAGHMIVTGEMFGILVAAINSAGWA